MKRAWSIHDAAAQLGLDPQVARALSVLVFGASRDVVTDAELARLAEAKARVSGPALPPAPRQPHFDERGQGLTEFASRPQRGASWLRPVAPISCRRDAEPLFARAVELEEDDPAQALTLYAEALAANPHHADAHVNRGRLLHQAARLAEAEAHYTAALVCRPADPTATFNLAVVLEDLGRADEAIVRYHEAIELDPSCVDAYFNLSRLYEKKGEKLAAIRHLKDYRRLVGRGR
jgi:tetratricopeptide (TPR) repeat protein